MQRAEYSGDLQPLIDWVRKIYPATCVGAFDRTDPPPTEFLEWSSSHFPAANTRLKFWASIVRAGDEAKGHNSGRREGWLRGFPHVHAWPRETITMILYLSTPDAGGEIGIGGYDVNDPYTFVQPRAGLAVFVDGDTWHGVKPVTAGERLAVIVTAFLPD